MVLFIAGNKKMQALPAFFIKHNRNIVAHVFFCIISSNDKL
jgi:hypothetical protein